MKCLKQLKVLLWKDYLLRIRHKGTLTLLFLWPVAVFLTLFIIRVSVNVTKVPTCSFKARALPSVGLMPFIQSYICSVNDECDPIRKFERLPSYKTATLTPLLRKLQPIVTNETIIESIQVLPSAVQLLNAFSHALADPDLKEVLINGIPISAIFLNPDDVKKIIIDDYPQFDQALVDMAFKGYIKTDHISELIGPVNVSQLVCDPEKIQRYIRLPATEDYAKVSTALCSLDETALTGLTKKLAASADVGKIIRLVFDSNFSGIIKRVGITPDEISKIIAKLPNLVKLIPMFSEVFADLKDVIKMPKHFNAKSRSTGNWLGGASTLLCGHSIIAERDKIGDIISKLKDRTDPDSELKQLPDNCKALFHNITSIPNGKLIWSYMKPLIRGKILYTPDNALTRHLIANANTTFDELNNVRIFVNSIYNGLTALSKFANSGTNINSVMEVPAVAEIFGNSSKSFSLTDAVSYIKGDGQTLGQILHVIVDVLDCVSVDRYEAVSNETELEDVAVKHMADNEFLAGVVFMNFDNDSVVPEEINYKIRMDIDNVPTTSRSRSQFWFPGPESEFEYQRYYRGFIQLQDAIDKSIMKYFLSRNNEENVINEFSNETSVENNDRNRREAFDKLSELGGTHMQEMPYPCWRRDPFQNGLYISQGLQVCFFFAFIMSVSSSVRYAVWERESGNVELMKTMGLRVWTNTLSWFITTIVEITIVIVTIVLILKICNILPNANWFLLFVYFMCYGLSTVMFCYMVQCFCNIASLAALGSIMFNFLTFMPYIIVIAMDAVLSNTVQILLQLSMSTSFSYGCLLITRLEAQGSGLTWDSIWTPIIPNGTNMISTAGMLLFDAVLYGTIGLCINSMNPVTYTKSNEVNNDQTKTGVKLTKVSKIYNKGKPDEKVALSDITIDLPEGQITALLGENGAGKTTLIKVLTGCIEKSSGEVNIGQGGQNIGVCPQSNVLFDVLTPMEHLKLYAKLKMGSDKFDKEIIEDMLSAMDLGHFENYFASHLSDGLKRRLCVAIAFIGYPKLIILDEPSSGVDPVARSGLLNLVGKLTRRKASDVRSTVLITTHHMDEADFISDTLMIMNKGRILAAGSPRELKQKYCNYVLTLTFPQKQELTEDEKKEKSSSILTLLSSVIDNAEILEIQSLQIKYKLPICNNNGERSNFYSALKLLEESQSSLGIDKFYLEGGDLSDVVLALCYSQEGINKCDSTVIKVSTDTLYENNGSTKQLDDDLSHLLNPSTRPDGFSLTLHRFKALIMKRIIGTTRNYRLLLSVLLLPALIQAVAMGFSLIKPPVELERPLKLNSDLYPGFQFLSLNSNNGPFGRDIENDLLLQTQMSKAVFKYQNITSECECMKGKHICYPPVTIPGMNSNNFENVVSIPSSEETVKWIVHTNELFIEKRYGGWSIEVDKESKTSPVVWYNNKGFHSMPGFLNTLNNVLLKHLENQKDYNTSRINTYSHPLRLSKEQLGQSTLLHHVADAGISLVILVGFSLVTASAVSYLVQERTSHEKRLQLLSGVNPVLYWCTALIWDLMICGVVLLIAVVIFLLFDIPVFTARDNLSGICLLLFLYCFSCLPLMYLLEKLFQINSLANMILFCCNVFAGMVTITTILLMEVLGKTQAVADAKEVLHSLFLIIPQFAMADGLIEISKNYVQATLLERFSLDTYISPLSWELMGTHYMMLIIVGVVLFAINILLEYHLRCPSTPESTSNYEDDDIDVQKEKVRVCERTGPLREAVAIKDIYKEYGYPCSAQVEAVRGVSFGVPLGQCFGLLGVNGAGKSTMFKMLIGELLPTRGILETHEQHNTGGISYCPQNDALDLVMTPEEHIKFYAWLRGIQDEELITRNTLKRFGLTEYRNVQVRSLSGGNKRKLNAAISIMGNSKIIIMDEPTSGMDPNSRALLLRSLRHLGKTGRSVLVTSHSMSDCEALCDRVAIMVSGRLLALGNPHELKQRFFSGYVISVHVNDMNNIKDVTNAISTSIPYARCLGKNHHTIQYLVPNVNNISDLFLKMGEMSETYEIDYTIALPSLDNVFVSLCKADSPDVTQVEKPVNGSIPLTNISLNAENGSVEDHNITRL